MFTEWMLSELNLQQVSGCILEQAMVALALAKVQVHSPRGDLKNSDSFSFPAQTPHPCEIPWSLPLIVKHQVYPWQSLVHCNQDKHLQKSRRSRTFTARRGENSLLMSQATIVYPYDETCGRNDMLYCLFCS